MDFKQYIDKDFRGCISVKKGDVHLFQHVSGYADLANKIPNRIDTRFATASAGKAFVAVGILQLIEKGLLHFDDTIGKLIAIDWHDIDTDITVDQLLAHRSGIPDYFDETVMDEYAELWKDYPNYKIRTSSDLLPLFIDKPMMYPKNSRFQYNNTGYVVLGIIIESITQKNFDQYLKENVFDICGMDRTGYYELDCLPSHCANSYIYDKKRECYRTNIYSVDVKGTGAGGAFTTIGDVERFWDGLLSYKLLSKEMTDIMFSRHSASDHGCYGYGLWISDTSNHGTVHYFTGSDPGVSFISEYKLDKGISITAVSNFGDNVWKVRNALREEFFYK